MASNAGQLVHQLRAELESSLAMLQQAESKRRMAESRASEAEQDTQEARQAMSRLKLKLSSAQEECSGLEEALQRERAVSVRLKQTLAQLGGGIAGPVGMLGGPSPWANHQAAFGNMTGFGLMGGVDAEMELLQQRRVQQQQASRHSALIAELEEDQRRLRQRCEDTRRELEALVQQQQEVRLRVEQGRGGGASGNRSLTEDSELPGNVAILMLFDMCFVPLPNAIINLFRQ